MMVYSSSYRTSSPPPSKRPRRGSEYHTIVGQQQEEYQYEAEAGGYSRSLQSHVRGEYPTTTEYAGHPPPPSSSRRSSLSTEPGRGDSESVSPSIRGPGPPLARSSPPPASGYHPPFPPQQPPLPASSSSSAKTYQYPPPQPPTQQFSQSREYRPPPPASSSQKQQYPSFPPHPQPTHSSAMNNGNPSSSSHHHSASYASSSSDGGSGGSLPPLSLSILGVEPLDEFIKEIADFVHHMIATRPEHMGGAVEVEAKVGVLRDSRSGSRLQLPVLVESILRPDALDIRFESNMTALQHKHYNNLLNNLKTSSTTSASPIEYNHLYLVDSFYPSSDSGGGDKRLRGSDKIRVTRDEKTGEVTQIVKKIRLGDLNIYSPKRPADWRISVNMEVPVSHPLGSPTHTRRKDRICYSHEEFVIDLTQVVSQAAPGATSQTLHELELEIARADLLLSTAAKRNDVNYSEHERSAFDELIRAFVNNARILVRNSPAFDN